MSDERFVFGMNEKWFLFDNETEDYMDLEDCKDKLNELAEKNEQLRFELETHKHPLWSTREAERKLSEVTDNLADEVKKNGLLNEELNQLRIENMRLKKNFDDLVEWTSKIAKRNVVLDEQVGELQRENRELRHELDSLTGCYCADNKEFKDYWRIGYDE